MAPEDGRRWAQVVCQVAQDGDTFTVQQAALRLAEQHHFPRRDAVEVAIMASELTSNILKYGTRGSVVVEAIEDAKRGPGVRVTAHDQGPPFADFDRAMEDGCDAAGELEPSAYAGRRGIGSGLGAVRRFSDELGWSPEPGGKRVWAVRFQRRP